jgi:hypothetical protein
MDISHITSLRLFRMIVGSVVVVVVVQHFAMSWGSCILVHFIAVDIRFLLTTFKEGTGA